MEERLQDKVSREEYIRLQQLRATDQYLNKLRETVWLEAATILSTDNQVSDRMLDQGLQLCQAGEEIDHFLNNHSITVDE